MSISVVILTLNEETNVEPCLDSVRWSSDVVVLDSYSTDSTVQLARARGARVVQRMFDNYAGQRNYALREVPFKEPWVLMLDADERIPDDLRDEMLSAVECAPTSTAMFRMRRKDFLFGRWLRGSSGYPTWFGRLMRVGKVRVERPVNEQYFADGDVGELRSHLHHFPFNKGFAAWMQKHDRYSTMEAQLLAAAPRAAPPLTQIFARDVSKRRAAQKDWLYRLPFRPLLVFAALYVGRRGFLDGRAGLRFSLLRSWYEYMIDCKYAEIRRRERGLPI